MPVPETRSAEAFELYVGGKCLRVVTGEAWLDIKPWTIALPRLVDVVPLPSVSEPFLAWTTSGKAGSQEMLDFCSQHHITADGEVIPIHKVNEAYDRMAKGDVKYRFSIEMASLRSE